MAVTIPDFWNLLVASRLAPRNSIPKLEEQFAKVKGAETQGNAVTLAQWLISHGVLSRYQAKVLLAGHPGPFNYGDYTVFDRHTEGRLQGAFRAIHPATRHRVMLWFHSGAAVQNPQWWAILSQQAGIFREAVHPQLARLFQLCDLGQFKFTVLEDLQGETALDRLKKAPLPWPVACRMVRQAAQGLARLFELGQLHGAIRPENLWIDEHDNVLLMLPPLARDLLEIPGPIDLSNTDPASNLARQADYLAPELAQPGQMVGGRTEIYALGCTLYHLLVGRPPFGGSDPLAKLANHAGQKLSALDATVAPPLVGQVLSVMMAKDPQRRYAHAKQVVDVFTQLLTQLDPEQLEWPKSPASNKIQEFESWLTPYGLAPASHSNEAPDITMPPILAAGLKPVRNTPAAPNAPPSPQPPLPPGSTPARRVPPPLPGASPLSRPPEASFLTNPNSGTAVTAPTGKAGVASNRNAATAPNRVAQMPPASSRSASPPVNGNFANTAGIPTSLVSDPIGSQSMNFPPDDDDFIGAITGQRRRPAEKLAAPPEPANRKRWYFVGGIAGVCVVLGLGLWLMMHGSHGENSGSGGNGATAPAATTNPTTNAPGENPQQEKPDATSPATSEPKTDSQPKNGGPNHDPTPKETGQGAEKTSASQARNSQASAARTAATVEEPPALWASPTHGAPLSGSYLPPRLQAMLVLRPADLLRHAEAEKIVAALGPEAQALRQRLESLSGASMSEIDQFTVAWSELPSAEGAWSIEPMYIVRFAGGHSPLDRHSPVKDVGPISATDGEPEKPLATFSPPGKAAEVLLIGSPEMMTEVASLKGQQAPMNRDLEKMLLTTDSQRLATLLWSPGSYSLLLAGVSMSGGKWSKLLSAARIFFGNDARAATLSTALPADNLFLELRVRGPLGQSNDAVANIFVERVNRLPGILKNYLSNLPLQDYGKAVLNRFPQMLKFLAEYTRHGSDGDQIVLRCYLPVAATQNLLLAGELTLAESAQSAAKSHLPTAAAANSPESIAQRLKRKTTLSFVNEPLDKTMSLLADDLGIKIEIIGNDLQLDGITKNQSIRDLNEHDMPAAQILRDIMLKANPDGKLVYVVKAGQQPGDEVLWITTRAAAKKRGDKLSDDLATPPTKK